MIARLNMGGPAHHVSLLSGRLDRTRYETLLVHGSVDRGEASLAHVAEREGCSVRYVPSLRRELHPLYDLRALVALVRIVREFRPHIVHTHTAKAGMLGRLAAVLAGRPRPVIIHTYHGHVLEGYFGRFGNALYRWIERGLAGVSDCLIGVSAATVDDLVRLGVAPHSKFRVVPIGLELQPFIDATDGERAAFRAEVGAAPGDVVVSFVGRLVPIKRVDLALEAVARARRAGAPIRLVVVGDGDLRPQLEQLAARLDVSDAVHFAGYRKDMVGVTAGADIALLTSDNEGTPVSLIEAAAAAKPAVATAVGGVSEVVKDSSGVRTGRENVDGLAQALVDLARDRDARRRMGEAARSEVRWRYSVERLLTDIDGLYEELLAQTESAESRVSITSA